MTRSTHKIVAVYEYDGERVQVVQYPSGSYACRYGVDAQGRAASSAHGLKSFRECKQALHKHRPLAQRIR